MGDRSALRGTSDAAPSSRPSPRASPPSRLSARRTRRPSATAAGGRRHRVQRHRRRRVRAPFPPPPPRVPCLCCPTPTPPTPSHTSKVAGLQTQSLHGVFRLVAARRTTPRRAAKARPRKAVVPVLRLARRRDPAACGADGGLAVAGAADADEASRRTPRAGKDEPDASCLALARRRARSTMVFAAAEPRRVSPETHALDAPRSPPTRAAGAGGSARRAMSRSIAGSSRGRGGRPRSLRRRLRSWGRPEHL